MTLRIVGALCLALPLAGCGGMLARGASVSARALVAAAPPPVDSADALQLARSAQSRFEIIRYNRLPRTGYVRSAPRCDEIIGRFCLWFDDEPDLWTPPPEAKDVSEAREGLLAWLEAAEAAHPTDRWIIGQRVRYLVEAGRLDEAAAAAAACGADRWWCLALVGYASHARGDAADAERRFDEALRAMPDSIRRDWTDIRILLAKDDREQYDELDDAERAEFDRRFWYLADPMQSRPGNAWRSEFFTRHVLVRLYEDARAPDRHRWGKDSREILLRYGPKIGWEIVPPTSMAVGAQPSTIGHFANGGRHFLPTFREVRDPTVMVDDVLTREPRAPRTSYALPYAGSFDALAHQIALFRRGDSTLVVASYAVPPDSLADTARVEAALVLGSLDGELLATERRTLRGGRGVLVAAAPEGTMMASVELLAPGARRAARGRTAVRAPWSRGTGMTISDLLLIAPRDDPPASLDEALGVARSGWSVRHDERVGIYWEVYAPDTLPRRERVTLTLTREDRSWPRRLAERLGLRDASAGLRLEWDERTAGRMVSRSLILDLSRIEPGSYTLEMRVATRGAPFVRKRIIVQR